MPNRPVNDGVAGAGLLPIRDARNALSLAKRDFAGFIDGDQPNLSEPQFRWLSYRMSQTTDADTLSQMLAEDPDLDSDYWTLALAQWRADPVFTAVEQISLGNKREGFRMLSVHMAGKALRRISEMLDSRDQRIALRVLQLWERTMGLLVDKVAVIDKDDLQRLQDRLMAPTKITPIEGPSIVDGEWRESLTSRPQETSGST